VRQPPGNHAGQMLGRYGGPGSHVVVLVVLVLLLGWCGALAGSGRVTLLSC